MSGGIHSETHSFSKISRKVVLNGLELLHSQCRVCGRDFVRTAGIHHWYAAYIGAFSIEVLSHEVSERWLTEPCPGERCASDEVDRLLPKTLPERDENCSRCDHQMSRHEIASDAGDEGNSQRDAPGACGVSACTCPQFSPPLVVL